MVTPIIVPVQSEKAKCPSCGKDEKIIEVCKHCGHEYKDEPLTFLEGCVGALIILFIIWFIVTLINWLFVNFDNESLFEIIKGQWAWLTALRIF